MERIYADRKYIIIGFFLLIGLSTWPGSFLLRADPGGQIYPFGQQQCTEICDPIPARGLVFDRNGKLLVYNEAAYDLMVVPGQGEEP